LFHERTVMLSSSDPRHDSQHAELHEDGEEANGA
jgi:hypothetical protein